jgi:hypothetical protein
MAGKGSFKAIFSNHCRIFSKSTRIYTPYAEDFSNLRMTFRHRPGAARGRD